MSSLSTRSTVLYGPNGSGKVLGRIVLGLLYKIRGSVAEKIRSIGGGAGNPYVEIDFFANEVQYRIEKTFADGNTASARLLNLNDGTELSQGDAAVIECRNLLTGSEEQDILGGRTSDVNKALEASTKGQIVDLILPKQGHLNDRPKENEALSSVGLEANAESQNYALNSMIAWAEAEKRAIKSSERANASGTLMDARRNLEDIATEEERLNELSNDLQARIRELNELEIEMGEEETEDDILERIATWREQADAHQLLREAAENAVREAMRFSAPTNSSYKTRSVEGRGSKLGQSEYTTHWTDG